uniref:NADH-ubiquinone oxidoreductase chain 4 n=1 Tax=Metopiellus crypticus TaxID=3140185 RepID=A0AAT9QF40_9COLE|nr:NADH dehydrogenase subunit 4 [Metopiellus sp.]UUK33578.1 NADH dehydrogenase subunit 4 [Metopiellus sp.]
MMSFIFFIIMMIMVNFYSLWLSQYIYYMLFFMFLLINVYNNIYLNLSYMFGIDLLSYLMLLLLFWICSLMILVIKKKNFMEMYLFLMLSLLLSLFCVFSTLNLFYFYIFFEISLIPMLIMILGWGFQPERLQAGVYLFFYMMFMSLPMLLSVFFIYENFYCLMLNMIYNINVFNIFIYLFLVLIFLVKMPMFMIHLWLPKAHVEAPVFGSMMLAGIMLKLGGYGMIRIMMIFMKLGMKFNFVFIIISLFGSLIISFICFRQTDMKSMIAYSSIIHMGLVISGIMTLNYFGLIGSLIMMLGHGLCSSGLFCMLNLVYERFFSRSIYFNKGLINLLPSLSLWWFLLLISNAGSPPSLNLLSEILLMISLVSWNYLLMLLLLLISLLSIMYCLYLFSYSQHGKNIHMFSCSMNQIREFLLLFLHWFPLNLLFLKSEMFLL